MKQCYLLFGLLLMSAGLSAQVYVNATAAGGDGNSWATAFNNLEDALSTVSPGDEVWVAAGSYVPTGTSFVIDKGVMLIGGFNGDETSSDQADPIANETILSGDTGNNDNPGDVTVNRDDNVRVLLVNAGISVVTISGFTFIGGETPNDPSGEGDLMVFSGAAILATSPLSISSCTFANNGSDFGAVSLLDQGANGSQLTNSTFAGNLGRIRGGGLYANSTDNLDVSDCAFLGNESQRGALYLLSCVGVNIESSLFENNVATEGRGGGLGVIESAAVTVTDCDFIGNQVITSDPTNLSFSRGAAVYLFDESTIATDPNRIVFTDCNFNNNVTDGIIGGAVYSLNTDNTWLNCNFTNNAASTYGSGIFSFATTDAKKRKIIFDNCVFTGHTINANGLGSCISVINQHDVDVFNTSFVDNGNEIVSGNGTFGTFGSFDSLDVPTEPMVYNFDNVTFSGNTSTTLGGAIYIQSPVGSLEFNINNTDFVNNVCNGGSGGAIFSFNGAAINLTNVYAAFNTANDGGFLHYQGDDVNLTYGNEDLPTTITSSFFQQNFSDSQGGAIDMQSGADLNLANSVFVANGITPSGSGSGGAIVLNGAEVGQQAMLAYNTFADNAAGDVGDDVAVFSSGLLTPTSVTTLSMVNNFYGSYGSDPGEPKGNVALEADTDGGMGVILSGGGNFFTQTPTDFSPNPADIINTEIDVEALFANVDLLDLEDPDFSLNLDFPGGNPLVDAAVVIPGIPEVDFNGLPRGNTPDIGAFEGESDVAVEAVEAAGIEIAFFPNPVKNVMTVRYPGATTTDAKITLVNMNGQRLNSWSLTGSTNVINLTSLPAGVYGIEISIDGRLYSKQIVKQ